METTTVDMGSGEPAPNHMIRQLLLLIACMLLALVPYSVPENLIQSLPRFGVVLYYTVLSLLAGWFGITWIWQAARNVLAAGDGKDSAGA